MSNNLKKQILAFVLLFIEFYFICIYRSELIDIFPILNVTSKNVYDDVIVSLLSSFFLSILQLANASLIIGIFFITKKTFIRTVQHIFRFDKRHLEKYISQMITFIFSTKCKWGVTQQATVCKNANTAEGLIACANAIEAGIDISDLQLNTIRGILDIQVRNLKKDGYLSFNENISTVHCTGMVLYAVKKYIDLDIFEVSNKDEERIHECLKNLLNNANDFGWGFINQKHTNTDYNRNLSTIWALRALNAWGYSENKQFSKIFDNLIHQTDGIIGFSLGSTEKYSMTAMLQILYHEIKSVKLKNNLNNKIDKNKVLRNLIEGLRYEVEVEEYLTSTKEVRKLSWTHQTECIVLEAIVLLFTEMNAIQIAKMSFCIKKMIKKINSNHGYYTVVQMNFKHMDPFFFPTTYLVSALSKMLILQKNKYESMPN